MNSIDPGHPFTRRYEDLIESLQGQILPSGLNDFSEGSVVSTLVRAFTRELKLLYDQMDEAYRRAFIDVATGYALDNVVALLGIERNPATPATGSVMFTFRSTNQALTMPAKGTRIADEQGRVFVTTEDAVLVDNADDEEKTVTATAPIEARDAGPEGNVRRNTITIMPTPPPGVNEVTNPEPTAGGQSPESDDSLRERAKNALNRSGNATLTAIEFAIREIDTVQDVDVLDHSRDDTIPLGQVRVRYSGGDRTEVQQVIDRTRAAGILVHLDEIIEVSISGTFYVIPEPDSDPEAASSFLQAVQAAIASLGIGDALSVRRLNALAYQFNFADVAEALLNHNRGDANSRQPITDDPFRANATELLRPDSNGLNVVVLTALKVERASDNRSRLTFKVESSQEDRSNNTVEVAFRAFSLAIQVTIRAFLSNSPTAPPERIREFEPDPLIFEGSQASFELSAITLQGDGNQPFDTSRYLPEVEITFSAVAYDAIAPAVIRIDVSSLAE